jgi:DNA-binding LacI/PurR family transcriptional regulator
MNINEFADKIGVSATTVSHTLTGRRHVSPKTRARVLEKMQELGYTPNMHAQRLASGRSHMIALDWVKQDFLVDLYAMQLFHDISQALQARGYSIVLNVTDDKDQEAATLRHWASSRAIDGLISLDGLAATRGFMAQIAGASIPCVAVGHQSDLNGVPYSASVVLRLDRGIEQMAKLLVDQGHRRIGFMDTFIQDRILEIFRKALGELGVVLDESSVFTAGRSLEDGGRALHHFLDMKDRPTAIFARTDMLAIGALREARSLGVKVPDDLSIVGHDDVLLASLTEPPITTVRVDKSTMANHAVDLLLKLIEEPEGVFAPRYVDTELVVRQSSCPVTS